MTFRNIVLASALFLSANIPAWSAGDNVVLIDVGKVGSAHHTSDRAYSQVNGTSRQKSGRGKGFTQQDQLIALKVPCSAGNYLMTPVNGRPRRPPASSTPMC